MQLHPSATIAPVLQIVDSIASDRTGLRSFRRPSIFLSSTLRWFALAAAMPDEHSSVRYAGERERLYQHGSGKSQPVQHHHFAAQ